MRDGSTRKMRTSGDSGGHAFFERFRATVVIVSGLAEGSEYLLDAESTSLGRGPGVDLAFNDNAMSREHAVLELVGAGFRLRDLSSTNGIRVNGGKVTSAELKHGDCFELGEHTFQFVVEERSRSPKTYEIS